MFQNRWKRDGLILFIFYFLFFSVLPMDAFARVGGGGSSGSRGSRSSTPPRSYSPPSPASPSQAPRESTPPPQSSAQAQPAQQPRSGLWGGIAGGILGGLIGGMLFSSLGFGGTHGGFGGGIGLFEILLFGALIFGIYWFIKARRRQAAVAAGNYQSSFETAGVPHQPSYGPTYEQQQGAKEGDLEKGLSYIRQMDASFDEKKFQDLCMDNFFKIQGAWANRDISGVRNLLTEEMGRIIQDEAEKLKTERKMNRLENIAVRSVDIVEAWQESGRDYITVRFYANLLDYTVDETTGQVDIGQQDGSCQIRGILDIYPARGKSPLAIVSDQPGRIISIRYRS